MATTRKISAKSQGVRRKKARTDLLIIECNTPNLARDGLHLGTGFHQLVQTCLPSKKVAIVQTSTKDKMRNDLADVFEKYGRFRAVLIVGHSDEKYLDMTADFSPRWAEVGSWIEIFEPQLLFLAACEAGQSEAVRSVFDGAGASLREVYACPVALHKLHTAPMAVLIFMLLLRGKLDPEQSQALRAVQYLLHGGQLYRWCRDEIGPGHELHRKFWDELARNFDFGPWDLLKAIFPNNP